ncbi:uncharacterized protein [Diabrotica undecimpunctata]|uniref:uncharacterized protein n=1 Tax=Diabrotica undecimpunctata TaxID=50387 RepID=UPI003B63FE1A
MKQADSTIKYFNIIFNKMIFLAVAVLATNLCVYVTLVLYTSSFLLFKVILSIGTARLMYNLFLIITSCDSLENSGKELIDTCYHLSIKSTTASERDALLTCAMYAERWAPVVSAGGFFDVNQCSVNKIFHKVLDYVVIMIQFNIMMDSVFENDYQKH